MARITRQDGFTLTELLIATTIVLLVLGSALTTVKQATAINDSAAQLADANQNLRAGTNTLIRDILMAGRIIGAEGISMPGGMTFTRPGPPGPALTFDMVASADPNDPTLQLPAITTGYQKGPVIRGSSTDIITIMTIDEFMPVLTTPPLTAGSPTSTEATISPDGSSITIPSNSVWNGDTSQDTAALDIGDLVFFKGQNGNAIQTVTAKTTTSITFTANADYFNFNPSGPVSGTNRPLYALKQIGVSVCPWGVVCTLPAQYVTPTATSAWVTPVTLFKAQMITYYVDNSNTSTPRLTRLFNHQPVGCTAAMSGTAACPSKFDPQALAGIVEDLDLTYDLYDGSCNPTEVPSLQWATTCSGTAITYTEGMIRKVNVHMGVRSETISKPSQDYVRNHISTSVNVRSLTSVDRYNSQ